MLCADVVYACGSNGIIARDAPRKRAFPHRGPAATARQGGRVRPSDGWPRAAGRALVYLSALALLLQGYSFVRKTYFVPPESAAYRHAEDVIAAQRALGLDVDDVELPAQRQAIAHRPAIDFFNGYYRLMKTGLYLSAAVGALLAPVSFRRYWRVFLLATLVALPWYAVYPVAPPRLMQSSGYPFVDTLAVYAGAPSTSAGFGGANQFAAMPSMHIGWTAIAVCWLATALPWKRIGLLLGGTHLALMSVAVVVTANHYVLDIIAGLGVAGSAFALAGAIDALCPAYARRHGGLNSAGVTVSSSGDRRRPPAASA